MVPPVLILILAAVAIFTVGISLPMALGRIPPNNWYGVRLPVTYRSRAAWDAANEVYGWWLFASGVLSFVVLCIGWFAQGTFLIVLYLIVAIGPPIVGIPVCLIAAYKADAAAHSEDEVVQGPAGDQSGDERDELPGQFQ